MNPIRSPKVLSAALALVAALGLAACKSGGDDSGMVNVGLTDAAGDFLSYTVDVTSLSLTKDDGMVVETLPQRTRVDLAQLTDLSEFITVASVPSGTYVSATLNLDFTNADLEVDKGDGTAVRVAAANIRDAQGAQISTLSMVVKLDGGRQLKIAPFTPELFDLDFNLAASNTIDMTTPATPIVAVSPILIADVDPDTPKPHRIRGPLASVDVQGSSFTLVLRPFNLIQGDHGRVTFTTNSSTQFEINQVSSTGAAGMTAMSQLPLFAAVVAVGNFVPGTRQFLATEVRAGSSVVLGTSDVLTGNVLARSGNTLTVKGAELVRSGGTLVFRDTVSVTVAAGTKVIRQGVVTAGTFADISVGQRVMVFGTLDAPGTSMDATSPTASLVRLLVTQLNGTATSTGAGVVGMALARIDGRPVSLFNFAGTGTPGNDADPAGYVVATGTLSLPTGIGSGTPLKVRGFPVAFNQGGAAGDFSAVTLIDVTNSPALLAVGWPALEPAPFTFIAGGVSVNLANAGLLHDVFRDGVDTQLATTDAPKVLSQGRGLFVIGIDGSVQVFIQFSAYQQALQNALGSGKQARGFFATGTYVDATKTLNAGAIATALH